MAIYFVDFDQPTLPGYQVNDPFNPMGATEFKALYPYNSFYAKGSLNDITFAFNHEPYGNFTIQKWDNSFDNGTNNPWRMNIGSIYARGVPSCLFRDGIIFAGSIFLEDSTVGNYLYTINCFIKANSIGMNAEYGIALIADGSTLIFDTASSYQDSMNFIHSWDSLIHINTLNGVFGLSQIASCLLSFTLPNAHITIPSDQNNVYGWVPPTWPIWDAPKQSFFISNFLNGSIPLDNGHTPYTPNQQFHFSSYTKDLWNIQRTGAGGGSFNKLVTSSGSITLPKIVVSGEAIDKKIITKSNRQPSIKSRSKIYGSSSKNSISKRNW